MSRSHSNRASFKIDSLLAEKLRSKQSNSPFLGQHMTIMFQGYFDRLHTTVIDPGSTQVANINNTSGMKGNKTTKGFEVYLLKVTTQRKQRKESQLTRLGSVEVAHNPPEVLLEEKDAIFPTISLDTELLDVSGPPSNQFLLVKSIPSGIGKDELQPQLNAELMILDKLGRCLLTEGDYQLSLQEALSRKYMPAAIKL